MATAVWNHSAATGQSLGANLLANPASPKDDSSSDSATISANDFLTLLVTEMQNQDPTANTDPNEYINQLVSVNSLEQLIDINTTLSKDAGSASSAKSSSKSAGAITPDPVHTAVGQAVKASAAQSSATSKVISGNLSVPAGQSAAQGVAHALNGRHKAA